MKKINRQVTTKDKIKIYYNVSQQSSRYCLVFLHGIGGDLSVWNNIRKDFDKKKISTIAIDLRGHGHSTISNNLNSYHIDHLTSDLDQILKKENFEKYILVGHSLGGMIAIEALEKHLPKIVALVLIDSGYKSPVNVKAHVFHKIIKLFSNYLPGIRNLSRRNYNEISRTSNLSLDRWLSDISYTSIKSWVMTLDGILKFNATKTLSQIKIPTLILTGENDLFFTQKDEMLMANKIRHSELIILPELNHISIVTHPKVISNEIKKFVHKNKI